jgi:hypothetical protein
MKPNWISSLKSGAVLQPGRLYLLLQRDLVHHYKTLTTAAAFGFGALLILNLLSGSAGSSQTAHQTYFSMLLFWGGLIVTSLSFTEIHRAPQNYFYLTLPASPLEKYLSKLLLTTLGYMLVSLAGYFLVSVLALALKWVLFHTSAPLFNPFYPAIGQALLSYLIANAVFLFGALFFRKTHFIKTSLSLIAFFFALFVFTAIVISLVFFDRLPAGLASNFRINVDLSELFSGHLNQWAGWWLNLLKFAACFVITPFFWVAGYFRLKESEVRNGV